MRTVPMTAPVKLGAGVTVTFDDQTWQIQRLLTSGHAVLMSLDSHQSVRVVDLAELSDQAPPPLSVAVNDTKAKQERLAKKTKFFALYLQLRELGESQAVEVAQSTVGIARSTAYTWRRQWITDANLIKEHRTDVGLSRLPTTVEECLQKAIEDAHQADSPQTIRQTYENLKAVLKSAGLPPVSYATVHRRVKDKPMLERLRPYGRAKAKELLRPTGKGEVGHAPLALVEIDHWMVDLILLNDYDRRPVGVAYLTLLQDTATRTVLGYYLSFDHPNEYAVGRACLSAFLPKTETLHQLDIQGDWPCWGIPDRLRPDQAVEFKGRLLQDLALKYRFKLDPARPYHPRDKAKIEAFFGTLSKYVRAIPGSTKGATADRKASASDATFTLREFEHDLVDYIVNKYHRTRHETLQSTPLKAYQRAIARRTDLTTVHPESLQLDVLPQLSKGRMVHPYGITIRNIQYWSDSLIPLIGNGTHYLIKYDPHDLSSVWLQRGQDYLRLRYKDPGYPALTLREYLHAQESIRAEGHDSSDTDAVMDYYRRSAKRAAQNHAATREARRAPPPPSEVREEPQPNSVRREWLTTLQPLAFFEDSDAIN